MAVARDPKPRRGRGRPRAGESDGKSRILAAAEHEFSEHGYDGATTRAIAARAGVDAAAIHNHFGTKSDLFARVIDAPIRPDKALPEILEGPSDEVGERIVRYLLETLDDPAVRRRAVTMLRTGVGNRVMTPMLAGFLEREVISRRAAARLARRQSDRRLAARPLRAEAAGPGRYVERRARSAHRSDHSVLPGGLTARPDARLRQLDVVSPSPSENLGGAGRSAVVMRGVGLRGAAGVGTPPAPAVMHNYGIPGDLPLPRPSNRGPGADLP